MRKTRGFAAIAAIVACCVIAGTRPAHAEDAPAGPPPDPTRGQWDSFLDPLRDFEDNDVTAGQKWIEDNTKIHVGAGISESWFWDFNKPPSGTPLPYDSYLTNNYGAPEIAEIRLNRPSEGWYVPGFGFTFNFGQTAKRIKSDWNADGVFGDTTWERDPVELEEGYLTWAVPDDGPSYLKGLTLKGGKFVTLLGAEVVEPWSNFNQSRSLLFTFAIPVTNLGALLSYPITDKLSVTGGPVTNWDTVGSNNHGWNGMGNVTYTATDQLTLAANFIAGPNQVGNVGNQRVVADLIGTYKGPIDNMTISLNYDWGHEAGAGLGGSNAVWQGLATIVNYNFTDRFSGAIRGEFFNDFDGARTGVSQRVYEFTLTAKYLITQHLYALAELRRDASNKNVFQTNNSDLAQDNPLIGMSLTYTFL